MVLRSSILVIISLLCVHMIMVMAVSWSKPGCPEKCGNITIPFPFGIGSKCSANSSFSVDCQNTTNPPRLFLRSINMRVLNISVQGIVVINHPVLPLNCSTTQMMHNLTSFVGTPFHISAEYNSLAVSGCETSVWLVNSTSLVGGCTPICDQYSNDPTCNGINCCQTAIPQGLQSLRFIYKTELSSKNNSSCGCVFLVEKRWLQEDYQHHSSPLSDLSDSFDREVRYVPLVLEWEFYKTETVDSNMYCHNGSDAISYCDVSSFKNCINALRLTSSYFGDINYIKFISFLNTFDYMQWRSNFVDGNDYKSSGLYCSCTDGFEGNPYLPGGCLDIDECNNATNNHCPDGTCINEIGTFSCQSLEGIYKKNHIKSRLKIAFISIGSMLGALILLVAFWKLGKAIRNLVKASRRYMFYKRNGGLLLEQQLSSSEKNGVERTKLFSAKELATATDRYNQNRILGGGGQGTVYKGMLTDGKIVAVKKSKRVDQDDLKVFINEVIILSQINHRNIVKLLGCCLETEVPLLVYEFIPNGTLFQHIHHPIEEFPFSWEIRLRVAREIAGALSYLHSDASAPVYHRDIKSTNILLDDKYRAKVSDFGTSRSIAIDQTHLTTRVLGTFGYLDPEYFQSSQFTEKSDVYSFGVVMVELLTGEKAISSVRADEGKSLATHFLHTMEENRFFEILDSWVVKEGNEEEIMRVAELAERCLHLNGRRRPTMKEIAVELEGIQMSKGNLGFPQTRDDIKDNHRLEVVDSFDYSSFSENDNQSIIFHS